MDGWNRGGLKVKTIVLQKNRVRQTTKTPKEMQVGKKVSTTMQWWWNQSKRQHPT